MSEKAVRLVIREKEDDDEKEEQWRQERSRKICKLIQDI